MSMREDYDKPPTKRPAAQRKNKSELPFKGVESPEERRKAEFKNKIKIDRKSVV